MKHFLLFSLFLIPQVGHPQSSASPTPVPLDSPAVQSSAPGTIRVRFYIPPMRGILTEGSELPAFPPKVWVQTAQGATKLELRRNSYTQPVELETKEGVHLYRVTPDGMKGELYVESSLPEGADYGVALLDPARTTQDGIIPFKVFPLSSSRSPAGWHTFQNDLEREVEIRIQDQIHHLAAGERISLKLEDGRQRISLMESGGKHSRRYSGAVYPQQDRGVIHIILSQPNSTRRLQVLSLAGPRVALEDEVQPSQ